MALASQKSIAFIVAGDVADAGTFTLPLPTGYTAASFVGGDGSHTLEINGATYSVAANTISVAVTTVITVTWRGGRTLLQGSRGVLGLAKAYAPAGPQHLIPANLFQLVPFRYSFGAPALGDDDGLFAAALLGAAGDFTLNGAEVTSGVGIFTVPRSIQFTVATTNQSGVTLHVYGTDIWGNAQTETLAGPNATTVQTARAYKTVTRVAASAAVATNGIKAGSGSILGLPFFLPGTTKQYLSKVTVDGVDELSSATVVAGVATVATATSGDVRGTVKFNTALDGTKVCEIFGWAPDLTDRGLTNYSA